jgi:hypothetical protein
MKNDEFPDLEEWIESNSNHGISEEDSIRSYTEYFVDNFDKDETIDLVSTMLASLREMKIFGDKLVADYQELIGHFTNLSDEVILLRRNLKDLTKK